LGPVYIRHTASVPVEPFKNFGCWVLGLRYWVLLPYPHAGTIQIEIGIAIGIEKTKMKKIDFDTDFDLEEKK
jgi:creatinine amidohydrolase/Fe(II)-dependent formamide hydrolase-like protein